jgi:MinD superfamily P-loop ATPase
VNFIQGRLNVGEKQAPPVIRSIKKILPEDNLLILDAPPGTSCPVVETVREADYTILVTEPTPFGLNDLKLAVELMRALKQPFGVIINQADIGTEDMLEYCDREKVQTLLEIPHDRRIAEAYSIGNLIIEIFPKYRILFNGLLSSLEVI